MEEKFICIYTDDAVSVWNVSARMHGSLVNAVVSGEEDRCSGMGTRLLFKALFYQMHILLSHFINQPDFL